MPTNATAFRQQWQRTSPAKRLLTVLTYLAKTQRISIPLSELEGIEVGEGVVQTIEPDDTNVLCLNMTWVPADSQMMLVDLAAANERSPQWMGETDHPDDLPSRLRQRVQPAPTLRTTLDDAEMAAREGVGNQQSTAVRRAREMREHPLPVSPLRVPEQ